MVKNYTLIHPTKSGGTAISEYLLKHYTEYFNCNDISHYDKCANENNPIICIRDVKSRFYSMYKYWKNGSEMWERNPEDKDKNKVKSIYDFIEFINTENKKELYLEYLWDVHYFPTSYWIGDADYKNIIIIKYEKNLNNKIQKLINALGIENKQLSLPFINVSDNENCFCDLEDKVVNDFINEYFRSDIELIQKINSNPELFKMVI